MTKSLEVLLPKALERREDLLNQLDRKSVV